MPRFLIDENLSPRLAVFLRALGYDAVAVRDVGLRGHSDTALMKWAKDHGGIIVTRDVELGEVTFWQAEGRIGMVILRSASQHVRAHEAVLHTLHRQGVLQDDRLAHALLVSTPTGYRWWSS